MLSVRLSPLQLLSFSVFPTFNGSVLVWAEMTAVGDGWSHWGHIPPLFLLFLLIEKTGSRWETDYYTQSPSAAKTLGNISSTAAPHQSVVWIQCKTRPQYSKQWHKTWGKTHAGTLRSVFVCASEWPSSQHDNLPRHAFSIITHRAVTGSDGKASSFSLSDSLF